MRRYALTRIAVAIPLLVGLSILVFAYVRLIPGDPVQVQLGQHATPELIASLRHKYGFDRPLWTQFTTWVGHAASGDFGVSFPSQQAVGHIIAERIPATLELAIGGLVIGLGLAIPLGLLAGRRPGSRTDAVVTAITLVGLAAPSFWLGAILVMFVSVKLDALPSQGYVSLTSDPEASIRFLLLPAFTLGVAIAPYLARMTRATVAGVAVQPFVAFARGRGISAPVVTTRYVLRNVWPSLITVIGICTGYLLAGSIVVEQLYNWPGTGQLIVDSVRTRDYNMIQTLILLYGAVFVVVNLVAELLQRALDPRISRS